MRGRSPNDDGFGTPIKNILYFHFLIFTPHFSSLINEQEYNLCRRRDGVRARDLNIISVVLYQLSYPPKQFYILLIKKFLSRPAIFYNFSLAHKKWLE